MKRNKLQQGRSISAGGHESRLDEFSSSGRLFLFHRSGKQRKLLHVRHQWLVWMAVSWLYWLEKMEMPLLRRLADSVSRELLQ